MGNIFCLKKPFVFQLFVFGCIFTAHCTATQDSNGNITSEESSTDSFVEKGDKFRSSIIRQPIPPLFDCTKFLAKSHQREICMESFLRKLKAFQQHLDELKTNEENSPRDTEYFITTSFHVNGYDIESYGLPIQTNLNNGTLQVEAPIGKVWKIRRLVDESEGKSQWDLYYLNRVNGKNVRKWVSISPPVGVNVTSLVDNVEEGSLKITGPADNLGNSTKGLTSFTAFFRSNPELVDY